jgi:hypothetical protein
VNSAPLKGNRLRHQLPLFHWNATSNENGLFSAEYHFSYRRVILRAIHGSIHPASGCCERCLRLEFALTAPNGVGHEHSFDFDALADNRPGGFIFW